MLTDIDYSILMTKITALEHRVKILEERAMSNPISDYYATKTWSDTSSRSIPCAFESIPAKDRMKPMGLVCYCSKCSASGMSHLQPSSGSLTMLEDQLTVIKTQQPLKDCISTINIDDVVRSI